ncbi:MAG: hypothetical protein Q4A76_07970 [Porphyromonadaceae bacterium]|nr:hypothetical protein [Porphyromonadaceae bacterium]
MSPDKVMVVTAYVLKGKYNNHPFDDTKACFSYPNLSEAVYPTENKHVV